MLEEQVRSGLSALADGIRPAPDPLGRLMARRRSKRRSRLAAVALLVASGLVLGMMGPFGAVTAAGAPLGLRGWVQQVVDAPARGAVATQQGTVDDLAAALVAQNHAGDSDPLLAGPSTISPAQRTVRVLFIDDIGNLRVAVAAFLPPADGVHQVMEDTVMVWMVAPRGATVATLASAARRGTKPTDTGFIAHGLEPFTIEEIALASSPMPGPMAVIGLAPPGCETAAAGLPAATDWRPEPTGSYIVRTPTQRHAEWWQVTCDGIVRYQGPAPVIADPSNADNIQVTDADVQAGLTGARGSVDPDTAKQAMANLTTTGGYSLTHRPVAIWGGRVSGIPPSDGNTVIVAAPMVGGGWAGMVQTTFDQHPTNTSTGASMFNITTDPGDPRNLLAIRLQSDSSRLQPEPPTTMLAVAPSGTVAVRVIQNGQQLTQIPTANGAAVFTAPDQPDITVEAITATGMVLARTTPVGPAMTLRTRIMASWDD
jgi:hypothetical protein